MQINSNSFKFSREEDDFYNDIENVMKKIAEENGKDNVEKISASIDKDSATITFVEAEDTIEDTKE